MVEIRVLSERFWAKVDKLSSPNGCWIWTGAKHQFGYGRIGVGGRGNREAHRVSWELHYGPIPKGKHVCHKCDNPPCVRPDHLFLGTRADNLADMRKKKRQALGDRHGRATQPEKTARGEKVGSVKLTTSDVLEIRRRHAKGGVTYAAIGRSFGVSWATIRRIALGQTWKHLLVLNNFQLGNRV